MPIDYDREYSDKVFALLEKRFPRVTFKEGDMIIPKGEQTKYVYRVRTGRVGVFSSFSDGGTDRAMWVLPGDSVGEIETLVGEKLAFDVVCCEDNTTAIRIPRDDYIALLEENNAVCMDAARTLARKLCYVAESYRALCINDTYSLLRRFVWRLARSSVAQFGMAVIPYTRSIIAEHCGVSERTVNRCIKRMEEEDLISVSGGKITVSAEQLDRLFCV